MSRDQTDEITQLRVALDEARRGDGQAFAQLREVIGARADEFTFNAVARVVRERDGARCIIEPSFRVADCESENRELLRQCRELAADIRFDATALPVEELSFEARVDGLQLVVDLRVPDRDKPDEMEWVHIWRTLICPWGVLRSNGAEYLLRWMRETIANVLAHEVDESLRVRGVRVFDPHRALLP